MIHKLKILPEFFPLVEKGKKRFELRKNDRNYQEDDILLLQEYFDGEYTDRQCVVKITNVFGSNNEESLWPELKKETIILKSSMTANPNVHSIHRLSIIQRKTSSSFFQNAWIDTKSMKN